MHNRCLRRSHEFCSRSRRFTLSAVENPIEKASLPPSLLSQKEIDLRSHLPRSLAHSVHVKHVFAPDRNATAPRLEYEVVHLHSAWVLCHFLFPPNHSSWRTNCLLTLFILRPYPVSCISRTMLARPAGPLITSRQLPPPPSFSPAQSHTRRRARGERRGREGGRGGQKFI